MKTMGDIIAQRRKALGMTQLELAQRMSVTDKAVSKWERNLSCPDVNSLSILADALQIPVTELLDAKSVEEPKSELQETISLILKAIPLAMGVAVTVLNILKAIDPGSSLILLGLGMSCLSINALNDRKKIPSMRGFTISYIVPKLLKSMSQANSVNEHAALVRTTMLPASFPSPPIC